jgi:hypothetical protein
VIQSHKPTKHIEEIPRLARSVKPDKNPEVIRNGKNEHGLFVATETAIATNG